MGLFSWKMDQIRVKGGKLFHFLPRSDHATSRHRPVKCGVRRVIGDATDVFWKGLPQRPELDLEVLVDFAKRETQQRSVAGVYLRIS